MKFNGRWWAQCRPGLGTNPLSGLWSLDEVCIMFEVMEVTDVGYKQWRRGNMLSPLRFTHEQVTMQFFCDLHLVLSWLTIRITRGMTTLWRASYWREMFPCQLIMVKERSKMEEKVIKKRPLLHGYIIFEDHYRDSWKWLKSSMSQFASNLVRIAYKRKLENKRRSMGINPERDFLEDFGLGRGQS